MIAFIFGEIAGLSYCVSFADLAPEISEAGRLIEEEEVSTGAVSYRYFVAYFRAATFLLSGLAVAFYSTRLSIRLYGDYWLTDMVDASVKSKSTKTNSTSNQSDAVS